nr:hypothetical protein [Tanacetum cinerariifolium]
MDKLQEIVEGGGKTVWGEPSAIGTVLEGLIFDVVLDYNGKDLDTVKPVVDWQVQDSFCSSAALVYISNPRSHHMLKGYMIGLGNNKDFEEWFFDRGGKTVWGEPSTIGTVLEGLIFDVVLDYNGKDLDIVNAGIYKQFEESPQVEGVHDWLRKQQGF